MRLTDAEKILSQWVKVANYNFKSKAQLHEKCFFLMKINVFLQCRKSDSHVFELFC